MVNFQSMERYSFQDLNRIMALLRQPGGCPWDREQTHESIRRNMLEEAYEAVEAIDEKDPGHLKEELGMCCSRWFSTPEWRRRRGSSPWTMWWTASAKSWCSATPCLWHSGRPGLRPGAEHLGRPEAGGEGAAHRCRHPGQRGQIPACPDAGGEDPGQGQKGGL